MNEPARSGGHDRGAGDPFDLDRFVAAQDAGGTYRRALEELRRGHKASHWMWFVFPQLVGLGHSSTSRRYGISSLEEARAYLDHPVLGPRIRECAALVAESNDRRAEEVLGVVDAQKLRSSMTLFLRADPDEARFRQVLDCFFGGLPDPATDELL